MSLTQRDEGKFVSSHDGVLGATAIQPANNSSAQFLYMKVVIFCWTCLLFLY